MKVLPWMPPHHTPLRACEATPARLASTEQPRTFLRVPDYAPPLGGGC